MSHHDDDDAAVDDVYPLHVFDDATYNHKFLSWLMRFNDVLDAGKLHDALARLLEMGDWRKLGGRLKFKDESGKLEVHTPKKFTADRPAVTFTHNDFSGLPIEEHPIACQFPDATDGPSIQPILDFRSLLAPRDYPKTMQDMISRHLPQISLHITSFNNATLVAIVWPHTLMDAIGQQALLQSWSLVLAGREQDVPPILGARKDILQELEDEEREEKREELGLEKNRVGILGVFTMMARFIWDKFWNPPLELRVIYLPRKALNRLQSKAQQQIDKLPKDSNQDGFVSEGDVLTAWIAQAVAETNRRPLTLISFFNPRYRIPRLLDDTTKGVYAQNMTQLNFTFCSTQLVQGDLGPLALFHRRQIIEQTRKEQTLSLMRTMRRRIKMGKMLDVFFGDVNASPIFYNNLNKVNLLKAVDFSPAVLSRGDVRKTRLNPEGTMTMYYNQVVQGSVGGVPSFYVLGKDYADNSWLMGDFLPQTWLRIDEELQRLKEED